MPKIVETMGELSERELRYHRARAAADYAHGRGQKPPLWALEEMWSTCLGPARPQSPTVPLPGKAEHEQR